MGKVEPTAAPNAQQEYSDAGIATLFRTHVAFMNTEATLIWMRFNVMLLGNAVFLGFLTRSERPSPLLAAGACVFGILLCVAWFILTCVAWGYLNDRLVAARKFKWIPRNDAESLHDNPCDVGVPKPGEDYIRYVAYTVIVLFGLAYLIGLFAVVATTCQWIS